MAGVVYYHQLERICWATCSTPVRQKNKWIISQVLCDILIFAYNEKKIYMLTSTSIFSQANVRKCERRSTCNTGLTLKANSADKSICYETLRILQFRDRQA